MENERKIIYVHSLTGNVNQVDGITQFETKNYSHGVVVFEWHNLNQVDFAHISYLENFRDLKEFIVRQTGSKEGWYAWVGGNELLTIEVNTTPIKCGLTFTEINIPKGCRIAPRNTCEFFDQPSSIFIQYPNKVYDLNFALECRKLYWANN